MYYLDFLRGPDVRCANKLEIIEKINQIVEWINKHDGLDIDENGNTK